MLRRDAKSDTEGNISKANKQQTMASDEVQGAMDSSSPFPFCSILFSLFLTLVLYRNYIFFLAVII